VRPTIEADGKAAKCGVYREIMKRQRCASDLAAEHVEKQPPLVTAGY